MHFAPSGLLLLYPSFATDLLTCSFSGLIRTLVGHNSKQWQGIHERFVPMLAASRKCSRCRTVASRMLGQWTAR